MLIGSRTDKRYEYDGLKRLRVDELATRTGTARSERVRRTAFDPAFPNISIISTLFQASSPETLFRDLGWSKNAAFPERLPAKGRRATTYDLNGNMTTMVKKNAAGGQLEKWLYTWNPRDQLTKVEKRTGTGDGTYAGKVEYAYCLSCDGALAHRKEYSPSSSTTITSWRRYEYDGLKLLRVDERCDADGDGEVETGETTWRTVEASTYGPGIVGNLLAKRVYTHTNNDATPDATTDYYYAYDHVGNVYMIFDANGEEEYRFNQDAFGNELNFEGYTGSSWATAAAAGIAEHQTGKWIDPFSGLYFFSARWYDSGVGRFVSRDPAPVAGVSPYAFCHNNPVRFVDTTGRSIIDIINIFNPFQWFVDLFNLWISGQEAINGIGETCDAKKCYNTDPLDQARYDEFQRQIGEAATCLLQTGAEFHAQCLQGLSPPPGIPGGIPCALPGSLDNILIPSQCPPGHICPIYGRPDPRY